MTATAMAELSGHLSNFPSCPGRLWSVSCKAHLPGSLATCHPAGFSLEEPRKSSQRAGRRERPGCPVCLALSWSEPDSSPAAGQPLPGPTSSRLPRLRVLTVFPFQTWCVGMPAVNSVQDSHFSSSNISVTSLPQATPRTLFS